MAYSHLQHDAPFWDYVYRQAFPEMETHCVVKGKGEWQNSGVDRLILLSNRRIIRIDEKVRKNKYEDILLEIWSSKQHQTHGWINKNLSCDYIAYAMIPTETVYLLPWLELQRAWRSNRLWWQVLARQKRNGFREVKAENFGYTTHSICVPITILLEAIKSACVISFSEIGSAANA